MRDLNCPHHSRRTQWRGNGPQKWGTLSLNHNSKCGLHSQCLIFNNQWHVIPSTRWGGGHIYSQKYIIQYNQIQIYPYTYFPLASSNQNIGSSLLTMSLPGSINALYWKPCRQLHLGRAIPISALWSWHLNLCAMEENMKSHTDNLRIIILGKFLVTITLNYPWKLIWVLKLINFPIHFVKKKKLLKFHGRSTN